MSTKKESENDPKKFVSKALDDPRLTVLWSTVQSVEQAEAIAKGLLQERLAACVQIDSPIISHYVWEGRSCSEKEFRVVIKTTHQRTDQVIAWLAQNHPYDEPQIIALPVEKASLGYARWVAESTSK
ncbi:divalent-cation tolerance protein CutA [Rhodopirellula sp. P2]|uniref:divalent-cation tolerance protein CutA n=1 Tax=Rhodopirellula sp. P2 TaxID=2127060 RepID=UPI0023675D7A|nr:divalent-cation tolerance protein CutA [Rhodopirellula sp. P2]WDQ17627.1 divalent-cation tolerance protein CutA [Rhodopirellula sp. P2]